MIYLKSSPLQYHGIGSQVLVLLWEMSYFPAGVTCMMYAANRTVCKYGYGYRLSCKEAACLLNHWDNDRDKHEGLQGIAG